MLDIHIQKVDDSRYQNIKFGINYRVFVDDEWIPIRIDKDWENPEYIDISLREARKMVEELGIKLRKAVIER
jgi:hypothetical protein